MAENKKNPLGIPQTKGTFELRGIVTGTDKDSFYKEGVTSKQQPYRSVNVGIEIDKGAIVYVRLFGMPRKEVYFTKQETVNGKRSTVTEVVPWRDRMNWHKEGFSLVGTRCGCEKIIDKNGNEVNSNKILTPFDACDELRKLKDGQSVHVRGTISHSIYNGKHQSSFDIGSIYLCSSPIDFEKEDFKPHAEYRQTVVFSNIEPAEGKEGQFIYTGKVIGYNSVEDAEFVIEDQRLARSCKKNLKPYCVSMELHGSIRVASNAEVVEDEYDEDGEYWGGADKMKRVASPYTREMLLIGVTSGSIERAVYTEENVMEAIAKANAMKKAKSDYGSSDDDADSWGGADKMTDDKDTDYNDDDFKLEL